MSITIDAVYEGGVLKPVRPLPLPEHAHVQVTIDTGGGSPGRTTALLHWTGSIEDLDYLIEHEENDPLETS